MDKTSPQITTQEFCWTRIKLSRINFWWFWKPPCLEQISLPTFFPSTILIVITLEHLVCGHFGLWRTKGWCEESVRFFRDIRNLLIPYNYMIIDFGKLRNRNIKGALRCCQLHRFPNEFWPTYIVILRSKRTNNLIIKELHHLGCS